MYTSIGAEIFSKFKQIRFDTHRNSIHNIKDKDVYFKTNVLEDVKNSYSLAHIV